MDGMGAEGKNDNLYLPEYIYFIDTLVYVYINVERGMCPLIRSSQHHSIKHQYQYNNKIT